MIKTGHELIVSREYIEDLLEKSHIFNLPSNVNNKNIDVIYKKKFLKFLTFQQQLSVIYIYSELKNKLNEIDKSNDFLEIINKEMKFNMDNIIERKFPGHEKPLFTTYPVEQIKIDIPFSNKDIRQEYNYLGPAYFSKSIKLIVSVISNYQNYIDNNYKEIHNYICMLCDSLEPNEYDYYYESFQGGYNHTELSYQWQAMDGDFDDEDDEYFNEILDNINDNQVSNFNKSSSLYEYFLREYMSMS